MRYFVVEITEIIVDHVFRHDDFFSRQDLRNLRLVNKHFYSVATPPLFRTVPFWLGLRSLEHLTLISEHPQISHYVTKLVFSPLRFVKREDPFSNQSSVRKGFELNTSHNISSLSFGKHVAAYKGYVEAQDYLSEKSQDLKILTQALTHLPRLTSMTVVFGSEIIGASEIMSAFGLLNGNEVTLDAEYTLPLLVEALGESGRELEKFKLVKEEKTSLELHSETRTRYNVKHRTRFNYISESPASVTVKAFQNAFGDDSGKVRDRVISAMRRLREFNMGGLNMGYFAYDVWSDSLEPIVAFASGLEKLSISPVIKALIPQEHQYLDLSAIIHDTTRLSRLRYLTLTHVQAPEPLLVSLFRGCSGSLVDVTLEFVRVGSWSNVIPHLRGANFNALCSFALFFCGEILGVVRAENYLKGITDKDPIAEYHEKRDEKRAKKLAGYR